MSNGYDKPLFRSGFTLAGDRSTGDVAQDIAFMNDSILTNGSWGVVRLGMITCMNLCIGTLCHVQALG